MSIRIEDKKNVWPLSTAVGLRRHGTLQKVARHVFWYVSYHAGDKNEKAREFFPDICMKLQYLSLIFWRQISYNIFHITSVKV